MVGSPEIMPGQLPEFQAFFLSEDSGHDQGENIQSQAEMAGLARHNSQTEGSTRFIRPVRILVHHPVLRRPGEGGSFYEGGTPREAGKSGEG